MSEGSVGRPVLRPAGNTTPAKSPAAAAAHKKKVNLVKHEEADSSPRTPATAVSKHRRHNVSGNSGLRNSSPKVSHSPKPGHVNGGGGACKSPRSPAGRSPNVANAILNKAGGAFNMSSCSCSSTDESPKKSAPPPPPPPRRKPRVICSPKQDRRVAPDGVPLFHPPPDKNRCAWITPYSDPAYLAFHDQEWGLPVHDDKRLFELLVLSGALVELTWPGILSARDTYRQAFAGFDPAVVATFDDSKIASFKYTKNIHEGKLHGIVNNARLVLKIVEEFGALDTYMWSFVGYKPIINRYRYPRQVPARTPKAEAISRDLLKRGFRFVGPTVIYSFMQVAGMTNDHLVHCFRWEECVFLSRGLHLEQYNKVQAEEMSEREREGDVKRLIRQP